MLGAAVLAAATVDRKRSWVADVSTCLLPNLTDGGGKDKVVDLFHSANALEKFLNPPRRAAL